MKAQELLNIGSSRLKSKDISSHRFDSELLLASVLKKKRENILINLNQKIEKGKIHQYYNLIKRRSTKEPIAYIFNKKEFWSMNFKLNNKTLIPRPETELLVEKLVKKCKKKSIRILDIGVGSGCILISLLTEIKRSTGMGIDISKSALETAKCNAKIYNLDHKIKFYQTSFSNLFNQRFDLIVSNPPYIRSADIKNLQEDVKKFEPKLALDGGNDGLDLIKKVIYKAKNILKIKGMLALEIGNGQFKKVSRILIRNNFRVEKFVKDYNENVRCILSKLIY